MVHKKKDKDDKNAKLLIEAIESGEKPVKAYERIYGTKYPSQGLSQWLRTHKFNLIKTYKLKPKELDKQD